MKDPFVTLGATKGSFIAVGVRKGSFIAPELSTGGRGLLQVSCCEADGRGYET